MKIRLDFVSNSSSSSFMLIGKAFDDDDEINKFASSNGYNVGEESDNYDSYDSYEAMSFLVDKFKLIFERGLDNYYDCWCVGLRYDNMKQDETRAQFEDRISKSLEEMTHNKTRVETLIDGGYDG